MFYPLLYKLQNTTHILNQSAMLKIGMMTEIISGKVTEERNGDYLLEIELLVTDDCADLLDTQLLSKQNQIRQTNRNSLKSIICSTKIKNPL